MSVKDTTSHRNAFYAFLKNNTHISIVLVILTALLVSSLIGAFATEKTGTNTKSDNCSWKAKHTYTTSKTDTTYTIKYTNALITNPIKDTTDTFNVRMEIVKAGGTNRTSSNIVAKGEKWQVTPKDKDKLKHNLTDNLSYTFDRGTSDKTVSIRVANTTEFDSGGNMNYINFTVPALPQYTVTFNANGGSGGGSVTGYAGKSWTAPSAGSKTGYTFGGWYTAATGGSYVGNSGTYSSNTTYYAHWNPSSYTVYFNANGGSCSYSSKTVTYGSTDANDLPLPSKSGDFDGYYNFSGWYDSSNEKVYDSSARAVSGTYWSGSGTSATWKYTGGVTLYAKYSYVPYTKYTVSFNGDGGTSPSSVTIRAGTTDNSTVSKSTRSGYVFQGWYTQKNGGGAQVYDSTGYRVNGTGYWSSGYYYGGSVTLYASWSRSNTMILNPNTGYYNNSSGQTSKTMTYGSEDNNAPGKADKRDSSYVFNGWYTSSSGGTRVFDVMGKAIPGTAYFNNQSQWIYTDKTSVTFYAQYITKAAAQKTVTLKPNTGTINGSENDVTKTVTQGELTNNSVPVAAKKSHIFKGYYTSTDGGYKVYDENGQCTTEGGYWTEAGASGAWVGTANLTLYAQWEEATYTATFDCEGNTPGGKYEGEASFTKDMRFDSNDNSVVPVPTLDGYIFQGWYTANKKGTQVFDKTGTAQTGNAYWSEAGLWQYSSNVTFHAQWRPDRDPYHFTISYSANGGLNAPADQDKTEWEDITLSTDEPTRLHFTFENWNTKADGSGTTYHPGDTYEEDEDLILYAQWTEVPQVGESLSARVVFTVGKSKSTPPSKGASAIGGSEYGSPRNLPGEGYQYELFQGLIPGGGSSEYGALISKVLSTGYKYHTRTLAFRDDGSKYGYHFIDLLGGISFTDN